MAENIVKFILFFPFPVGFIYFIICSHSDFIRALQHCKSPLLVRSLPLLFFCGFLFDKEGLIYRNSGFKNLFIALLFWVIGLLILLITTGEASRLLDGLTANVRSL